VLSFGELAASVLRKHQNSLQDKGLSVAVDCPADSVVLADRLKIEQVVTNLLTNAVRHTPTGGRIAVRVQPQGERLLVAVENEGKQIPVADLEKIWYKFYRVDKARNRKQGGTGLGLSIVQTLLQLHQSEYGVRNTGSGVQFYFTLQRAEGQPQE
jgi:signal transduction histidine kinase